MPLQFPKGSLGKGAGILLCKMTGGFWQCVAERSCQCLRRPDFFCMPKRNRGKKTAAGGGLFTRRPPPAPLPPDPSVCPASHLGGVYTTAAPAEAHLMHCIFGCGIKSPQSALRPAAPLTSKGSLFAAAQSVKPPLRAKGRCRTPVRRRGWAVPIQQAAAAIFDTFKSSSGQTKPPRTFIRGGCCNQ